MKGPLASKSQALEIYRLNNLGQLINPKYLEQNTMRGRRSPNAGAGNV